MPCHCNSGDDSFTPDKADESPFCQSSGPSKSPYAVFDSKCRTVLLEVSSGASFTLTLPSETPNNQYQPDGLPENVQGTLFNSTSFILLPTEQNLAPPFYGLNPGTGLPADQPGPAQAVHGRREPGKPTEHGLKHASSKINWSLKHERPNPGHPRRIQIRPEHQGGSGAHLPDGGIRVR